MVGSVNGTSIPTAELRSTRKPRLLFRLSGVFLLRFAERQLSELLFQLTPRFTGPEELTWLSEATSDEGSGATDCYAAIRVWFP
jgi:succinate dehydrogenase/fumarate reductase cytochrome b subunit